KLVLLQGISWFKLFLLAYPNHFYFAFQFFIMKHAYIFPGQGAHFSGMGKSLYDSSDRTKKMFAQADEIVGFGLADIMFSGSDEQLKQTKVTQPAVFLHAVIRFLTTAEVQPDCTAGHSLGEFSALVAAGA